MFFGYPATVSSGFSKGVPAFTGAVAPFGKFPAFGFGKFPFSFASGGTTAVPATTVATSPFPI